MAVCLICDKRIDDELDVCFDCQRAVYVTPDD